MKRNLKNVLIVGGIVVVAVGFTSYFSLQTMVPSSVPQWVVAGISAVLGIAASVTATAMVFSLDQDLLKKTDYKSMEKKLYVDDADGKWYTKYVKKNKTVEEVTAN
ncbi:MAG: hypothetical protein KBC17_01495 [Candidatus Pacebacteria bacterium]|nr:hypothetical protein [Candidatus Paceibacterota bacterium]